MTVAPEIAARMAMGVLFASGLARREPGASGGPKPAAKPKPLPLSSEPLATMRVPTIQLIGVIVRRLQLAVAMRVRGFGRRSG